MDTEDLYLQGFQARCSGDYGRAKLFLESVLKADPQHINARHQMGLILGFEGDFEASLNSLADLSRQVPGNLDIKYDLAMTYLMLGMYDEGCALLSQILAVDPTHQKALDQSSYCP
jgi:tetratricopeptide (TPR) repeat protein